MVTAPTIRRLSDLAIGDEVLTPSGRLALVKDFAGGLVVLAYFDDGDEVDLPPQLLKLHRRPPARPFPARFFEVQGQRFARAKA